VKQLSWWIGLVVVTLGVLAFIDQGFTYPRKEKLVGIGAVHVSRDTKGTVHIPPIFSGAVILLGALLMVPRSRQKS
jgi:hypothetical protein